MQAKFIHVRSGKDPNSPCRNTLYGAPVMSMAVIPQDILNLYGVHANTIMTVFGNNLDTAAWYLSVACPCWYRWKFCQLALGKV